MVYLQVLKIKYRCLYKQLMSMWYSAEKNNPVNCFSRGAQPSTTNGQSASANRYQHFCRCGGMVDTHA